ncbi:MAG: T9SS type A sorting domain-containing protein [Flavobacteriales bacterium]|nr:T9SS type A sorting domain-containing protein [Flavobacteriales bacterium]
MGQFFEQGYGKASNDWTEEESALDILPIPYGLALCGWISHENGKRMALWQTDTLGRLYNFAQHGTNAGYDQIAAALALSHSGNYLLTGRQTDFFVDSQRHSLQNTDLAALKYLGPNGDLLWEYTTDSIGSDTGSVAVDVVYCGQGEFTVLLNLVWGETPRHAFRLLHIDSTGQALWQTTHDLGSTEIFAEKLLSHNGEYIVLVNRLDNPAPMLWQHTAQGAYNTHSTFSQAHHTWGYGLTNTTSGFAIAGKEYNGSQYNASLLRIAANLSQISHSTHNNSSTGNAWYEDLTAHPNGFVAIGQCDNKGEGQQDIWICHTDTLGDTLKTETLGGEENDYGHAAVLLPQLYSAFIAGYNSSYGITESGNAYLGGVKVDMGLPESGECEIPRILEVEMLEGRDINSGLILPKILDPSTNANTTNLISYCITNKITQLALFKLGFIFDDRNIQHQYIRNDKLLYKNLLDTFLQNCANNGIHCGYVADKDFYALDSAANHNIQKFSYNQSGKFHFVKLEHEYWNVFNDFDLKTLDGSPTNKPDITNLADKSLNDAYFQEVHQDHLTLLARMRTKKFQNANLWEVYDYIAKLYCEIKEGRPEADTSNITYNFHNQPSIKVKAQDLDGQSDAIMLLHYQSYHANDGIDFLDTNSSNFSVNQWRKRLSYFGNSSTNKTIIIPLFSTEDSAYCGQSIATKFLGHVLEGAPYYGSKTLTSVEGAYNQQHKAMFNSTNNLYSQVSNTQLGAYAWFKYDCIKNKTFSSVARHKCDTLGFGYNPLEIPEAINASESIILYPNPNNGKFIIKSNGATIEKILVYDNVGRFILNKNSLFSQEISIKLDLNRGLYMVAVVLVSGEVITSKIIVQ